MRLRLRREGAAVVRPAAGCGKAPVGPHLRVHQAEELEKLHLPHSFTQLDLLLSMWEMRSHPPSTTDPRHHEFSWIGPRVE